MVKTCDYWVLGLGVKREYKMALRKVALLTALRNPYTWRYTIKYQTCPSAMHHDPNQLDTLLWAALCGQSATADHTAALCYGRASEVAGDIVHVHGLID